MKKHIYVLIIFIILTILTAGIWKSTEQTMLNKYLLTDEKIEEYQTKLKGTLIDPSDALIEEMTDSYKVAAQKEYEERVNSQVPIPNVILISVAGSLVVCAIIEVVLFVKTKKKQENITKDKGEEVNANDK